MASATEAAATHIRYLLSLFVIGWNWLSLDVMVWNWFFFGGVVLVFLLFCDCVVGLENGKFGDVLLGVQLRLLCPSHTADE